MAKPPMIPGESKEDRRRRLVAQSAKRYRAKQRSKATADRQNAARAATPLPTVEVERERTERPAGRPPSWPILGAVVMSHDGTARSVGLDGSREGESHAQWLSRRDAERELPGNPPVRIEYDGTHGAGTLGIDILDSHDIRRAASMLSTEGLGSEATLLAALSRAQPGSTVRLYLDEPEATLREHETGHGLPVTFTPEMLAR